MNKWKNKWFENSLKTVDWNAAKENQKDLIVGIFTKVIVSCKFPKKSIKTRFQYIRENIFLYTDYYMGEMWFSLSGANYMKSYEAVKSHSSAL
jgi:hypothetical protein